MVSSHLLPAPHRTSPTVSIPPPDGPFVTVDEPTLMHQHYQKSTVYGSRHSKLYILWVWANVSFLTASYRIVSALKTPCAPPSHPPPLQSLIFYCLHSCAFSRLLGSWNHTACSPFRWLLSLSDAHLRFLRVFSWLNSSCLLSTYPLLFLTALLK